MRERVYDSGMKTTAGLLLVLFLGCSHPQTEPKPRPHAVEADEDDAPEPWPSPSVEPAAPAFQLDKIDDPYLRARIRSIGLSDPSVIERIQMEELAEQRRREVDAEYNRRIADLEKQRQELEARRAEIRRRLDSIAPARS